MGCVRGWGQSEAREGNEEMTCVILGVELVIRGGVDDRARVRWLIYEMGICSMCLIVVDGYMEHKQRIRFRGNRNPPLRVHQSGPTVVQGGVSFGGGWGCPRPHEMPEKKKLLRNMWDILAKPKLLRSERNIPTVMVTELWFNDINKINRSELENVSSRLDPSPPLRGWGCLRPCGSERHWTAAAVNSLHAGSLREPLRSAAAISVCRVCSATN